MTIAMLLKRDVGRGGCAEEDGKVPAPPRRLGKVLRELRQRDCFNYESWKVVITRMHDSMQHLLGGEGSSAKHANTLLAFSRQAHAVDRSFATSTHCTKFGLAKMRGNEFPWSCPWGSP